MALPTASPGKSCTRTGPVVPVGCHSDRQRVARIASWSRRPFEPSLREQLRLQLIGDQQQRFFSEAREGATPSTRRRDRSGARGRSRCARSQQSRSIECRAASRGRARAHTSAGVVVFLEAAIRRTSNHDDTGGLTIASGRGAASSRLMGACRVVVPGGSSAGSAEVRTPRVQARTIGH